MIKKYIYNEITSKNSILYRKQRKDYYIALEKSIMSHGATSTITEFENFLNGKIDNINKDSLVILSEYKIKDIIRMLKIDFGNKKTLNNLIKNSIDNYLSKKINILKSAIIGTYRRYDLDQAKLALRLYYKENNIDKFIKDNKKIIGGETLKKEISLDILKLLVGAKLNIEFGYLLDDYENKFSISRNITCLDKLTEKIITEYIN